MLQELLLPNPHESLGRQELRSMHTFLAGREWGRITGKSLRKRLAGF